MRLMLYFFIFSYDKLNFFQMSACLIFLDYLRCLKLIVFVENHGKTTIFGRIRIAELGKSDYKEIRVGGLDSITGVG